MGVLRGWFGSAQASVRMWCSLPLLLAAYLWYCRIKRSLVGSTGGKFVVDVFVLGRLCGKFVWKRGKFVWKRGRNRVWTFRVGVCL